jgi:citrate synthase
MAIKTAIGYATPEDIFVRGRNLANDVMGKLDFVDMIYFTATGETPSEPVKRMTNAILVTAADHGLTPISVAARLTHMGAPEALQGAVAAGLLGAGDQLLGTMQNAAQLLQDEIGSLTQSDPPHAFEARAKEIVQAYRKDRRIVPGFGHFIHPAGDPRAPALRRIAAANGFDGKHWTLFVAIEKALQVEHGRLMPMNAAGAVGATVADMGMKAVWARSFALIGRCAGLVAHLMDEMEAPIARKMFTTILAQDDSAALAAKGLGQGKEG